MTSKIILSSQPGSANFSDRVLLLDPETVTVSRSSTDEKPETDNAVFDCRVLSKAQAVFSLVDEKFYLKDTGSSNGTFINNFRLSQAGKQSEETQIYSQDIIRFGSQVETDKTYGGKAKCIVARIQIYFADGTEFVERAVNDKFFRCKEDICGQERYKQVKSHHQAVNIEDKVDQLEHIIEEKFGKENEMLKETVANLEKKLRRKQNENVNLLENIAKVTEDELHRVSEIYDLKEALECQNKQSEKLKDELAIKVKEQLENLEAKDLKSELERTKIQLKTTSEEILLLKEKLKIEEDTMKKKDKEISKLSISLADLENCKSQVSEEENDTHIQMKTLLKDCWKQMESQKVEIKQLNDLVTKGDEILEEKEEQIDELTNLAQKDKEEIKLKEGEYVNLKSLINEENETVQEIQIEMKRLLNIIAEDQETILQKDQTIKELENNIKEKYESLRRCDEKDSKSEQYFEENSNLKAKIDVICSENEAKVDNLQIEMNHLNNTINEKEEEIKQMKVNLEKQDAIFTTYESLESKIKESMHIIEHKSKEIEIMQNGFKNQTSNDPQIEECKKEISELKASVCEKESEITNLNEVIDKKDKTIVENNAKVEKYIEEGTQLVSKNADQEKKLDDIIMEREEIIPKLRERVESDQTKINHVKSEFDNLKNENKEYLRFKDEEIENLKCEIIKEKQIVAHVQYRQKREIVKKEREISILNTILMQERKILLEKEEEVKRLRTFHIQESILVLESPPARPPRNKSMVITAAMQEQAQNPTPEQADIPNQPDQDDDNSDTVTFHDALNNDLSIALSDEEDVLIEDLELDEETDDRQPRRSDIDIENF
eukprot:GFUD01011901.1.p1 GENE.GFUD01011901.1~~GFUD01011901.1.p1  ORF type:complete len:835 (-),score=288.99 GFUD01011901.1:58-2562(-)